MSALKTENIRPDFPASGIRVREYFACMAMQAYAGSDRISDFGTTHDRIAIWSVEMADALIEELNRNSDETS